MMKKQLLLLLTVGTGLSVFAQNSNSTEMQYLSKYDKYLSENSASTFFQKKPGNGAPLVSPLAINSDSIGTSGNIFTILENRTYVWADPTINTVAFVHRKRVGTGTNAVGFLTFDYSKSGGTKGTWVADSLTVYDPGIAPQTGYGARYPQGVIYNPPGNTVADSAYFSYYAPTLDNSNPGSPTTGNTWGGIAWGGQQISGLGFPTQVDTGSNMSPTTLGKWFLIPESFTITKTGVTHALEINSKGNPSGWFYQDTLLHSIGNWDTTAKNFVYTRNLLRIPMSSRAGSPTSKLFADAKISFADNGMDGYISIIGHNDFTARPDSTYYLIIYKTTDGGNNWTGPTNIMLDGVHPLFPQFAGNGNQRYTAAFEHDAVVDSAGNIHIVVGIGAQPATQTGIPVGWSIASGAGNWGLFDVYTLDGGTTWMAKLLDKPQFFRGVFGNVGSTGTNPEVRVDTRPHASRSWDGDKVIFSWFVSDSVTNWNLPHLGSNVFPDLFTSAFDINTKMWTDSVNQTGGVAGAPYAGSVYFGSSSYYTFNAGSDKYKLPVVYADFAVNAQTDADVQFRYLDSVIIENFDNPDNSVSLFTGITGIKNNVNSRTMAVSQNIPNPFSATTVINVTLASTENVSLEVYNSIGQLVTSQSAKSLSAGNHQFTIDGRLLDKGIYFYTVKTGNESVTKRMIVQ